MLDQIFCQFFLKEDVADTDRCKFMLIFCCFFQIVRKLLPDLSVSQGPPLQLKVRLPSLIVKLLVLHHQLSHGKFYKIK